MARRYRGRAFVLRIEPLRVSPLRASIPRGVASVKAERIALMPHWPARMGEDMAALYLGVSMTRFRERVKAQTYPQPVREGGRLLWAKRQLDPDPTDPTFAEALARVNGKTIERARPQSGTVSALIAELRPVLAKREMASATRSAWGYYLGLIEEQHGKRLVADLERAHCYRIRDGMADEPGKANNYMAKFKALLEFGAERGWIRQNPAAGVPLLEVGEYAPWPKHVLAEALAVASPMDRLIIITGLCSGQRASDAIRIPRKFDGGMIALRSKKTSTIAAILMHPLWRAEIDKTEAKAVTVLYDRSGRPFASPGTVQARIRRLMKRSATSMVRRSRSTRSTASARTRSAT
jgi:hypothetical protein